MQQLLADLLYSDSVVNGFSRSMPSGKPPFIDESRLIQQVLSSRVSDRVRAAESLGSLSSSHYYFFVLLLKDEDEAVRQAALTTLGYDDDALLWQELVAAVGEIETRRVAAAMLVALGPAVISAIENQWNEVNQATQLRLIRVLERIGGHQALTLLANELHQTDEIMRTMIIQALNNNGYCAQEPSLLSTIEQQIHIELEHAASLLAASMDLSTAVQPALSELQFLNRVLNTQLKRCRQRILACLALLPNDSNQSTLAPALHQHAHQFLLATTPEQQWQQVQTFGAETKLDWFERLLILLERPSTISDPWLWVCTAYTVIPLGLNDPRIINALTSYQQSHPQDRLVMETVNVALAKLNDEQPSPSTHGYKPMFSTIERVIFLKGVDLFYETPDAILIELASLLEEVDVSAHHTIFEKGTAADCMYIIVEGQVKVHDGEQVLNYQSRGDVFGELALLDDKPRLASITAMQNTRLLKLDQDGFYLLMEDHIEFARGIIRVLSGYLRGNLHNITDPEFRLSAVTN